jgi:regulator of cell morphogenesis and NO signaling
METVITNELPQTMSAVELCEYIVQKHHRFQHEQMLGIKVHLASATKIDGDKFPDFDVLETIFSEFRERCDNHLRKERLIIFPLAVSKEGRKQKIQGKLKETLESEFNLLKRDHGYFKKVFSEINRITSGYHSEPNFSPTSKLSLTELAALEKDIMTLIELEENILFPLMLNDL